MNKADNETTLDELKQLIAKFRDERGWSKHHTPKNLAISISIEAAELMEHFQWEDLSDNNKQDIESELADILMYCFNFAETMDIDMSKAFRNKLKETEQKYPLEIFRDGKDKPDEYKRIKDNYRQDKK